MPARPVRDESKRLSLRPIPDGPNNMRATLLSTLLLSALLAACATERDSIANKNIAQQGTLKVHPGLVDKSAPAPAPESATPAATAPR